MCMVPTVCGGLDIAVGSLMDQKSHIFPARVPSIDETVCMLLITHTILYLVASADGSNDINIHILILFFLLLKISLSCSCIIISNVRVVYQNN